MASAIDGFRLRGDKDGNVIIVLGDGQEINMGQPLIREVGLHHQTRMIDVTTLDGDYRQCVEGFYAPPIIELSLQMTDSPLFSHNSPEDMSIMELFGLIQQKIAERDNNQ